MKCNELPKHAVVEKTLQTQKVEDTMKVTDSKGRYSSKDIEEILSKKNRDEVRNRLGRNGTTEELMENFHLNQMERQLSNDRQAI